MTKLTLYHASPSRSAITLWMLEEVGQPYDLHVLDLQQGEQKRPDYLALNPMGKVPTLKVDGEAISEAAAICLWLADAFPDANLAPPIGDPRRAAYLKWMFFGPSVLEPAMFAKAFPPAAPAPQGSAGWGDFDTVMDVVAKALGGRPFILGDQFTAADVVIGSGLGWGMKFGLVPSRDEFTTYVQRLDQRPAARRAVAKDEEIQQKRSA